MFIPVKVTADEFANKLLDGEVYLRPVNEFGIWARDENRGNATLDNNYRGDLREGTVSIAKDASSCEKLKGIDPAFKKYAHDITFIDDYEAKYFKIYSLYCLDYDPFNNCFMKPDVRIEQFGDAAVVIRDINEFLRRVCTASMKQYEHSIFMMDRMSYYDYSENREVRILFEKNNSQAYQKELRIVMCELEQSPFSRADANGIIPMTLVWDLNPIILNIGDIRDIAYKIPTKDFVDMRGLNKHKYRWPHSPGGKTIYENIVEDSRKQIDQGFYSPLQRLMFTIYGD